MSTLNSSGSAAPSSRVLQASEPGASLQSYSEDLKNGANNFVLLLDRIREISSDTVLRLGEEFDGRDYRAIAFEIETSIYANLMGCTKITREGYLRALADFLSTVADGSIPSYEWDYSRALATTATAYGSQGAVA